MMFRRFPNRPAGFSGRPEFRATGIGIALAIAATLLAGCSMSTQNRISYPSFYPGNEKIIFTYSKGSGTATLVTYDLASNQYHIHERQKIDSNDRIWVEGSISDDGQKIVFSIGEKGTYNFQLAIMNVDGTGLRKITNTPGYRGGASFSPDGKRILYLFSSLERRSPTRPIAGFDVFEIDISTGQETRLTNYEFYWASTPHYLPDGERFIFSGDGPSKNMLVGSKEYEKKYKGNIIFVMDRNPKNELVPFIEYNYLSKSPSISLDGSKILFVAGTNDKSLPQATYDLFIWNGGETRQLTRGKIINGSSISRDGSRVVFVTDGFGRNPKKTLWVMNADGSGLTEIPFPAAPQAVAP